MANRLAAATSPYLLQHADNPVDWWEWGAEAFDEARRRDVPVLLSVGYAACHWCHVMAHESFEDITTAELINANFVAVKVDREERPDIDAVYMEATQAMTGHGGWPMTCVLAPDARPFFAGTYFPRDARHGMPAFARVLAAISSAWRERRAEVVDVGKDIAEHLSHRHTLPGTSTADIGAAAVASLATDFDERYGGFGSAPKFPPSMVCEFLLRRAARTGDAEALAMAEQTLEAMARGGIYDQLGGGFARYSVDGRWDVPHFEKMLYDNALLLRVYLHWWRQTGHPLARRVAYETATFMCTELVTDQGGFSSALDADSEGREGTFYVWRAAEIGDVLGEHDGGFAINAFGVSAAGNFERGTSTLRLDADPEDPARLADVRNRLLEARGRRVRPDRDDKVVAAWNGLAIAALAEAGVLLDAPDLLAGAIASADLVLNVHLTEDGRLRRVSRNGLVGVPAGVLEDYACMADGLLALFAATGEPRYADHARGLTEQVLARFADGAGGLYDTADDAEVLMKRPQDPADNASPSGQAMALSVLIALAGLTGDDRYAEASDALGQRLSGLAERAPRFAGQTLSALEAQADGPRQLAVVGPAGAERTAFVAAAHAQDHPGQVIAVGDGTSAPVALLDQRTPVDGQVTAYPCRHFVCDLPVTDVAALA